MEAEKISTQMKKGVLEYIILSIISRGDVYASDILTTLKDNNLLVVEGTLYPLLSRLKDDKVVNYTWIESQQGPPRKYYALTKEGHMLLEQMRTTWQTLSNAVTTIDGKSTGK